MMTDLCLCEGPPPHERDPACPPATNRRVLTCWHIDTEPSGESGDLCDETLEVVDGAWVCPKGHRLRRYEDLSRWLRDHIGLAQTDPAMWGRYFDPKGDRG